MQLPRRFLGAGVEHPSPGPGTRYRECCRRGRGGRRRQPGLLPPGERAWTCRCPVRHPAAGATRVPARHREDGPPRTPRSAGAPWPRCPGSPAVSAARLRRTPANALPRTRRSDARRDGPASRRASSRRRNRGTGPPTSGAKRRRPDRCRRWQAVSGPRAYAASTGAFSTAGSMVRPASSERSTRTVSPALKRPTSRASARGSSIMFWMTRRRGRAP